MPHINLFLNESESEQRQQRQPRGVYAIYFSAVSPLAALSVLLLSEGNVAYCLHNGRSLALCMNVCVWKVCVSAIERTHSRRFKAAFAVFTNINEFLICFI